MASTTITTSEAQPATHSAPSVSSKKRCQKCTRKASQPQKDRMTIEYQQTWQQYERSRSRHVTLPRSPELGGSMPRHIAPRPTYLDQAHAGLPPSIRLHVRAPSAPSSAARLSSAEMVAKLHEAIARHQESLRRVAMQAGFEQPGQVSSAARPGAAV